MDSDTPRTNSSSGTEKTPRNIGTELNGSLVLLSLGFLSLGRLRLGRLSLCRPATQQVRLLHKPMLRIMLLSLGLLSLGRPGTQQVWLLGTPTLRPLVLSPLLHLRHLVLLSLGQRRRVVFNLL